MQQCANVLGICSSGLLRVSHGSATVPSTCYTSLTHHINHHIDKHIHTPISRLAFRVDTRQFSSAVIIISTCFYNPRVLNFKSKHHFKNFYFVSLETLKAAKPTRVSRWLSATSIQFSFTALEKRYLIFN